ncbi:uncharacterized protein LOC130732107 [Lotus japonicus]|uniref:uncharacterized protein LOC130732107 n=1 Tax=Lotus japonicus TaxID=34305 RepID=UPI00258B4118|nr:uncharacterized protein LOC130732107 [Lotus japonicus]
MDIDLNWTMDKPEFPLILLSWLQNLVDMTSLSVTTNTLQVLFLVPDFLKIKLPTLANLKIFKIKKVRLSEALRGMVIKRMERQMVTTKSRIQAIRLVLEIGKWKARNEPFAPFPEGFSKFLDLQVLPFGTIVETERR